MRIPKIINKGGYAYKYIKMCNNNMFLYESELGFKETFSKYDLGLLNNTEIDNFIAKRSDDILKAEYDKRPIILYDRQLEIEKQFKTLQEVGFYLDCTPATVSKYINHHWWYKKRYFIERGEISDE